jgi:Fe-S-cluster containining protein
MIKEGYVGEDNTINGNCSKCGECCGVILPIDQEDAYRIFDYVQKKKIHVCKTVLVMKQKLQCPYYSGKKEGCLIYEARPKICRMYRCDKKAEAKDAITLKDAMPIDMWGMATDIEKMIYGDKK